MNGRRGKVTRGQGHVGRRAGVEVPLRCARWCLRDADRVEGGVESSSVERVLGRAAVVTSRHGVLRLEGRPWAENTGPWRTEWHRPRLHHALPWVVAGGVGCTLVVGGVVVGPRSVASAAAVVATAPAASATTSVGTIVGAPGVGAVVVTGGVGGG